MGEDPFGNYLFSTLENVKVNTNYLSKTNKGQTALAFVSIKKDGNRDFTFYGKQSADTFLCEDDIHPNWFENKKDILHFGSIGLLTSPSKEAHIKAIKAIKKKSGIVSFDPNIRLSLFNNEELYRNLILETIPLCNLLKISSEEIEFVTGIKNPRAAIETLFIGDVDAIIYTKGPDGAEFHTKNFFVDSKAIDVPVKDTTGAGDAFIGSFLYKLAKMEEDIQGISKEVALNMLEFANAVATISTTKSGAITSFPEIEEVEEFVKKYL